MDVFTKGALWDYWKMGGDEIEVFDDESFDLEEYWNDKEETTKNFKIETDVFDYETPPCLADSSNSIHLYSNPNTDPDRMPLTKAKDTSDTKFFTELRSPDFNLFSDQEYSEEDVTETMAETMEQYMSKTRADYGSGVARPKIEDKDNFELKGQFLKELRTNTFSGSDHEGANEHIEKVLEIVDLFHIPNITIDQVMLRAFPMSLN
ncbi:hypothetical protein Tco_0543017 [Tanacetum coccineum]